ncbi:hypothetical protein HYZ82_00980 [Candidatus Nomurabacteria bacterium]|nr:hypothetical protein [Candidatus Nomurabacteria bacterium]
MAKQKQLTIVSDGQALTISNPQEKAEKVFDLLDVSEATRQDYKYRIGLFLDFTGERGFNRNSFLDFKRALAERTDLAVATKNKYLATAKIFLKELNRIGKLPADITQNIKTFSQSKKHKRDGLNDEEMSKLTEAVKELPDTPQNARLKAILSLLVCRINHQTPSGDVAAIQTR